MHANHLEKEYGAGPHTISVPRMRPADGSDVRAPLAVIVVMVAAAWLAVCDGLDCACFAG